MRHTTCRITSLAIALGAIVTIGCSTREPAANAATTPATSAPQAAAPQAAARTVCAMLTAAEMSTILGTTVGSDGAEGSGSCHYKPAEGSMPYVEVSVDRGGGSAAMVATRMLGQLEPGMTNRLAGLGDEASAIGPAFMIRTGEDLVTVTLTGVSGDDVAIAKQIIATLRPRMGASAQPEQQATAHGGQGGQGAKGPEGQGSDRPEERAAQVVGGLLAQLTKENQAASREPRASGSGASGSEAARTAPRSSIPADLPTLGPAKGPSIRIPLIAELRITSAIHQPGRGDYEPMLTVTKIGSDAVSTVFSADLPEGNRLVVDRVIRHEDLKSAREYRNFFELGDPPTFPGTTVFRMSTEVYSDLKTKGKTDFTRLVPDEDPLARLARRLGGVGSANVERYAGVLERIEPHALAFPVLVNDELAELPVIHVRGRFADATVDFHVLDDPENPLILWGNGYGSGGVIRLAFPTPDTTPIEAKLKNDARVELHGIYFDFDKATIRPESESVLREIASALTRNPEWKIGIEGHTDNIGGEALNLDLSRRRADAVKQALVDRYRISASHLTTAGFGATRPNASNDTISGRARNRRVELVRQ